MTESYSKVIADATIILPIAVAGSDVPDRLRVTRRGPYCSGVNPISEDATTIRLAECCPGRPRRLETRV